MIRDVKSLAFFLRNRKSHPRVRIGWGSRVINSTFAGADIQIGRDCYVRGSAFSRGVIVKDRCAIFESAFDSNSVVYSNCSLSNVKFGSYSYVNEHSEIGNVTVGRFCSIGPHFVCGYGEHPTNLISTSPMFYSTREQCGVTFADKNTFDEQRVTNMGNDVWIGARVFIRDGVRIGNGALIAAGAVITADVPDYAIVGGVPGKIIRYRFPEEVVRQLLELEWWNWGEDRLREAQPLLSQPDVNSFLAWAKNN